MLYMVTFTINISPMLAYIPYMDPMGNVVYLYLYVYIYIYRKSMEICQNDGTCSLVSSSRWVAHEKCEKPPTKQKSED